VERSRLIHIALLRGINVGGHKQISMADLRDLLTQLGLGDVRSLLQSGNLVFGANGRTPAQVERLLEVEAEKRLGLQTDFLVRTAKEWEGIVAHNPFPKEARAIRPSSRDVSQGRAQRHRRQGAAGCYRGPRSPFAAADKHLYIVYPDVSAARA